MNSHRGKPSRRITVNVDALAKLPFKSKDWRERLGDWDKTFGDLPELQNATLETREELTQGFAQLREVLGLDGCIPLLLPGHPLADRYNRDPWSWHTIAWLGRSAKCVEHSLGFERVRKHLIQPNAFESAEVQVHLGARCVNKSIVVEFEPHIDDRHPDIALGTANRTYVEIKVMDPAEDDLWQWEMMHSITSLITRQVFISGVFWTSLSKTHFQDLLAQIREAISKVPSAGTQRLYEKSSYDLHVYPTEKRGHMPYDGLQCHLGDTDDAKRIGRLIRDAGRQLPTTGSGIVEVRIPESLGFYLRNDPLNVVVQLERYVFDSPHISAAVVSTISSEKVVLKGRDPDRFSEYRIPLPGGREEHGIVIKNRYAHIPIRPESLDPWL